MSQNAEEPAAPRIAVVLVIMGVVLVLVLGLIVLAGKLILDGVGSTSSGGERQVEGVHGTGEKSGFSWQQPGQWIEFARSGEGVLRMRRATRAKRGTRRDPWIDEFETLGPLSANAVSLAVKFFMATHQSRLQGLENYRKSHALETPEELLEEAKLLSRIEVDLAAAAAMMKGNYFTYDPARSPEILNEPVGTVERESFSSSIRSIPAEVCVVMNRTDIPALLAARTHELAMELKVGVAVFNGLPAEEREELVDLYRTSQAGGPMDPADKLRLSRAIPDGVTVDQTRHVLVVR